VSALKLARRHFYLGLIFLLFSGFILFAIILPNAENISAPPLSVGDVAPYDIQAPFAVTYQSQILTAQEQDVAAADVTPIYSPVDTSIARQQLERLHNALVYITSVRADNFATID
jgi:membrane-associated HD superfamily phosphohydrolase